PKTSMVTDGKQWRCRSCSLPAASESRGPQQGLRGQGQPFDRRADGHTPNTADPLGPAEAFAMQRNICFLQVLPRTSVPPSNPESAPTRTLQMEPALADTLQSISATRVDSSIGWSLGT